MRYGRGNPKEGNPNHQLSAALGECRASTYRLRMAYATRPMHDADSHIMEPPAWLEGHLADEYREKLPVLGATDDPSRQGFDVERVRRSHASAEYRAEEVEQLMLRKNFLATGSF